MLFFKKKIDTIFTMNIKVVKKIKYFFMKIIIKKKLF